ncbi:nSTAND1 domain-containing NTPase [Streptomyces cyaneochromogenes]|uniref:nSTAND1 domain-containing NTPase n=1 Tax=Streptomyces cyaneochromogenes TaxID=2496836 RepID=UPI0026C81933|nr:hypothetical protein [Streptomyces cyaneochromogenes]
MAAADRGDGDEPYLGLARFEAGDRRLFFGRERLIEDLLALVREHRFAALLGASGSGKSSARRSGRDLHDAARLNQGGTADRGDGCERPSTRSGAPCGGGNRAGPLPTGHVPRGGARLQMETSDWSFRTVPDGRKIALCNRG